MDLVTILPTLFIPHIKKSKYLYFSRLGVDEFNRFKEIYFFSYHLIDNILDSRSILL